MAGSSEGRAKRWLLAAGKIGLSVVLLAWALSRVEPDQLWARISSLDPRWIAVAAVTFALSNILGAFQWARLLELTGVALPFRRLLSFYWVGLFFSNLLPANVGGDVVRVYDVARSTGRRRSAVGATLLDRLIGFVAMSLLGAVALPFVPLEGAGRLLWLVIIFFCMVTLVLSLCIYRREFLGLLERRLEGVTVLSIGRRFKAVADELYSFRHHTGSLVKLAGVSIVIQVLRILVHVMVARGMGIKLAPAWFFVIVPILAVVVVLPVSIAGLGVRESAAVGLFGRVGLGASDAVVHQLGTFILTLAINLIGGVIFITRTLRRPSLEGAGEST